MDDLVAQGLFEPWEGTYRITKAGMEKLKELEKENIR
jgi:predicted transcriptional regulator